MTHITHTEIDHLALVEEETDERDTSQYDMYDESYYYEMQNEEE
jgi:hypothetical protein